MHWIPGLAWASLAALTSAPITAKTVPEARVVIADSLDAIKTDYNAARGADKLDAEVIGGLMERCRALAEETASAEERFDILKYAIGLGSREASLTAAVAACAEPIFRDFPNDAERLVPLITRSLGSLDPRVLKRWGEQSEDPSVKAACLFAPVQGVLTEMRRGPDPDEATFTALMANMDRIAEEFGDAPNPADRDRAGNTATWAETVAGPRFQLQHLRLGQVPPDIVAKDLDGVEFRLSDYRGKVVVLDFWGDW